MEIYKKHDSFIINNKKKIIYRINKSKKNYILFNKEYIPLIKYLKTIYKKINGGGKRKRDEDNFFDNKLQIKQIDDNINEGKESKLIDILKKARKNIEEKNNENINLFIMPEHKAICDKISQNKILAKIESLTKIESLLIDVIKKLNTINSIIFKYKTYNFKTNEFEDIEYKIEINNNYYFKNFANRLFLDFNEIKIKEYIELQIKFFDEKLNIKEYLLLRDYVFGSTNHIIKYFYNDEINFKCMPKNDDDDDDCVNINYLISNNIDIAKWEFEKEFKIMKNKRKKVEDYSKKSPLPDYSTTPPFYSQFKDLTSSSKTESYYSYLIDIDSDNDSNNEEHILLKRWTKLLNSYSNDLLELFDNNDLPLTNDIFIGYKGVSSDNISNNNKNGYYDLPNFTSITFDPNIALKYMKDTKESVLYRFIIPVGFKLLFVESFNEGTKKLFEFILPKNTKVNIKEGIIKKDIYDIDGICPKLNKTINILDIYVL